MSRTKDEPKHKHLRLSQAKISRARRILGARTDTEAIERALDFLIAEDKRDRDATAAHHRFLADAASNRHEIRDVFGALDDRG